MTEPQDDTRLGIRQGLSVAVTASPAQSGPKSCFSA